MPNISGRLLHVPFLILFLSLPVFPAGGNAEKTPNFQHMEATRLIRCNEGGMEVEGKHSYDEQLDWVIMPCFFFLFSIATKAFLLSWLKL